MVSPCPAGSRCAQLRRGLPLRWVVRRIAAWHSLAESCRSASCCKVSDCRYARFRHAGACHAALLRLVGVCRFVSL